jgi:hypothetical protein
MGCPANLAPQPQKSLNLVTLKDDCTVHFKKRQEPECHSGVEHLPSMGGALGLSPSDSQKKKRKRKKRGQGSWLQNEAMWGHTRF